MKALIMPVLAAALLGAACGNDGDPMTVSRASVRFFNATTGMTGNGAFTTNGTFATGSALAFGQSACSKVDAASTSFGFGAANSGGTGLNGTALATLANQTVTDGGNYTVAAMGSAASPQLFLIDNTFSGTLTPNEAAVRFVNLTAGTNNFAVFSGVFGLDATFLAQNFAPGAPTMFRSLTSGSQKFSMLRNLQEPPAIPQATFNLQAGSVNTIAIVPTTTGGFQMINLPSCS
jgi:hypothetical protein